MQPIFRIVALPDVRPGPLLPLASKAAALLLNAKQSVTVFESTTAGLIQAALQSVPGASAYTTCGAVTYSSKRGAAVLGSLDYASPNPRDGAAYKASKNAWTETLARTKRVEVGATWCIAESGACGPTFLYPDINTGFTSIFVSGPVERGIIVESPHNKREENMWGFTKLALDLLTECVEEATQLADAQGASVDTSSLLTCREDRYGGVEADVPEGVVGANVVRFGRELKSNLDAWKLAGKRGIWLKVPLSSGSCVGSSVSCGFVFHHAKRDYVMLTCWLPNTPSHLPEYGFTQIGVGGVVVNSKGEVLMVQERVSPTPQFQGSWKLPGGLADVGEDFAQTVLREVREETGVTGTLAGVVSIRHSHGYRFDQGDLYVLVKLLADKEEINMCTEELLGAEWMSPSKIQSLVADASESLNGRVSANNWTMIRNALEGKLIEGSQLPNQRGPKPSMLYTASTL